MREDHRDGETWLRSQSAGVQPSLADNKIHGDLPPRSHPVRSTLRKDPTVQFLGRAASNMRNFVDRARLQATMVGCGSKPHPLNPRRISSGCDASNFLHAANDLAHQCLPNTLPPLGGSPAVPPGHIAARDAFRSMRGESEQTVRALLGPELPCVVVATASFGTGSRTWSADENSKFAAYFSP